MGDEYLHNRDMRSPCYIGHISFPDIVSFLLWCWHRKGRQLLYAPYWGMRHRLPYVPNVCLLKCCCVPEDWHTAGSSEEETWTPFGSRTRQCRRRCFTEWSVFTQCLHREVEIINNCHVHSAPFLKHMQSDSGTPLRSHSYKLGKKMDLEKCWKSF